MAAQPLPRINLFEMTRPQVEQAIAAGVDTVIVTFGATEQHGLHLPMGTDSLWGEVLGERVALALGDALVAPGVRIGCSQHHMAFAGSLTLSHETFVQTVMDICRALAHHGFRHLVLIPTHGGNFQPLAQAVARLRPELPNTNLIAFTDLNALMDVAFNIGQTFGIAPGIVGGHAGEFETSLMLALRPELVHMELAQAGYTGDQMSVAPIVFEKGFRAVTENGILGDARPASIAHGDAYMRALTDALVAFVQAGRKTI